ALEDRGREAFIAEITRDVPETPVYFLHSRDLNQAGPSLDDQRDFPRVLTPGEAQTRVLGGAVLLDARADDDFARCHPAGALHVGLDGQFASWVGTLVRPDQNIVLMVEPERAEEAVMRLARVGYERVVGILDGGCDAWRAARLAYRSIAEIDAAALDPNATRLLDVRRPSEWEAFHIAGAEHAPLAR